MIKILKIGENAFHDSTFIVNRPLGHPAYLLLLIKTPSLFFINTESISGSIPKNCAVIFKPYQKHLYKADENCYIDCWMHIDKAALTFPDNFPFGIPVPLNNYKSKNISISF